jgi:hypothetical protein
VGEPVCSAISLVVIRGALTLEIPRPRLTPRPLNNHHRPAPAIPANPVPDDQAPRAVREEASVGSVVVIWRKVNSPRPDDSDASAMPNSRGYREDENAIV